MSKQTNLRSRLELINSQSFKPSKTWVSYIDIQKLSDNDKLEKRFSQSSLKYEGQELDFNQAHNQNSNGSNNNDFYDINLKS